MTEQEALALKPGDRVEARYGNRWHVCEVVRVQRVTQEWVDLQEPAIQRLYQYRVGSLRWVWVRRTGAVSQGGAYPCRKKWPVVGRTDDELRFCLDPVAANVYADWLWENGFEEAAEALRRRASDAPCTPCLEYEP